MFNKLSCTVITKCLVSQPHIIMSTVHKCVVDTDMDQSCFESLLSGNSKNILSCSCQVQTPGTYCVIKLVICFYCVGVLDSKHFH